MGRRTPVYRAAQTCILGLILLSFASASSYLPRESPTGIISNDGFSFLNETSQLTPRDEKPFTLRIMPLGASITYGYQSTNGNGYRRWLRQQLRHAGWWVNMVGSNPNDTSTMNDNEVEATSGFRVDQVTQQAERPIPQQPNLILINAGTNDANQYHDTTVDVYKTGERMGALLKRLFDAIPGTTIILRETNKWRLEALHPCLQEHWSRRHSGEGYSDGVYCCDIRGTGADDYVGNFGEGQGYLYGNVHDPPVWKPEGIEIFNVKKDRKSLHLADIDGDGKDTGEAEIWLNKWSDNAQGDYFQYKGVLTGNARCTQGWGVGLYDLGLRFADLDGDGRADYLCMDPDGRTDGWLNKGENSFESIGQVKRSEHYDRANHRWADVNGDRMADFLWIDKFNGDTKVTSSMWHLKSTIAGYVKVWINQGPVPTLDSKWRCGPQDGPRYMGADRGANMHFPNLGGLGRADYHQVIPRTNIAYTWFNECPNEALDDDDSTEDPKLPQYPAPAQPASINNNGANDAM
ncbi:hypothetical protein G4B84_001979 [Aspergillus flavus NRRL3357]|nr:uncharacterized protein G4B84_001979 [Aspergillus flavus NRRL3357]QMW26734.1 hypothetical protein G4B84_001979 [Aspergillus flavus NRRL3357]